MTQINKAPHPTSEPVVMHAAFEEPYGIENPINKMTDTAPSSIKLPAGLSQRYEVRGELRARPAPFFSPGILLRNAKLR